MENFSPFDFVYFSGEDHIDLLPIVGGVFIIKSGNNNRQLVFGCYPDQPGVGGVGYIDYMRDEPNPNVNPITVDGESRKAGSVFVTNTVPKKCADAAPPICLGPPAPTTEEPEVEPEEPEKGDGSDTNKPPNDEGDDVEIVVDNENNQVQKPAGVQGGGTASALAYSLTALILPLILCLLS